MSGEQAEILPLIGNPQLTNTTCCEMPNKFFVWLILILFLGLLTQTPPHLLKFLTNTPFITILSIKFKKYELKLKIILFMTKLPYLTI